MKRPDQPQPLTLTEAIIPVGSLIALVGLSYFLFGDAGAVGPNQVALVVATMLAVFIGWRRGHSLESLGKAATESVATGIGAVFILFAVGALIGTWAMSGTLVAMVYYGLQLLSPNYFYVTACAICGIVSASIGSSWTVVGTIGVGFMGIAVNMGLNPAIAAGAVISGAYFGDKSSPLSDSANLAAAAAGVDLYRHIRETLLTSVVALAIALGVFFVLGQPGDYDATGKMAAIQSAFHISPVLFLPLAVVVVLALFRSPPFTAIFLGALAGGVLAVVVAPERVIRVCRRRRPAFVAGAAQGRLARAGERVHVDHGLRADGHAGDPRRHGQHAQHDLAHRHRARVRRGGGEGRRAGTADHADHREGEIGRRAGRLPRVLDRRDQRHHRRPVHRHRAAGTDVQERVSTAGAGAGRAVAHRRRHGDADVRADTVEQLRRLHGCDAGRGHVELRPLRGLQHREPAADDRHRVRRHPDAARARGRSAPPAAPAPVPKDSGA